MGITDKMKVYLSVNEPTMKYKMLNKCIQVHAACFVLNIMELCLIIYKLKINITDMKNIKFNRKERHSDIINK